MTRNPRMLPGLLLLGTTLSSGCRPHRESNPDLPDVDHPAQPPPDQEGSASPALADQADASGGPPRRRPGTYANIDRADDRIVGRFVVSAGGSDPCTAPILAHGMYATNPSFLWILFTDSPPHGECASQYTAAWAPGSMTFQMSVDAGSIDDCTSAGQFGDGAVLTKR